MVSMSESRLIGRRSQLNDLQQHIYHALSGQPRVLLIEGLAGMGKTRLLQEMQSLASQQSMAAYYSTCDETATEPYAPFVGLLPRLEEANVLETHNRTLLHRLFGTATDHAFTLTIDEIPTDSATFLLSISHALAQMASTQPLLLLVDNLHAADRSSLDLFEYLAFNLAEQRTLPIMLVGSHHPVAPETPVGRLLNRLQREPITHPLALSGLEESETRVFLQHLGVERPTQQLVQAIQQTTHGIPLFIQEAVHHAHRVGALYTQHGYLAVRQQAVATLQLPRDISSAMTGRIDTLPAACQAILMQATLLGDAFSTDRLGIFDQTDRARAEAALETASQHGVLHPEANRYHFTHALIRQVLIARLSQAQRQQLHLHIARRLQQTRGAHLLEITHHLIEAGPLVDAHTLTDYAEHAGNHAFSRFAWD